MRPDAIMLGFVGRSAPHGHRPMNRWARVVRSRTGITLTRTASPTLMPTRHLAGDPTAYTPSGRLAVSRAWATFSTTRHSSHEHP